MKRSPRIRVAALSVVVAAVGFGVTPAAAAAPVARKVAVAAQSTFAITPADGWLQYHGDVSYTKITVLSPSNGTVPSGLQRKVRAKCLERFDHVNDEGGYVYMKIVELDPETGQVARRLSPGNRSATEADGHWATSGYNATPGNTVKALGIYWDQFSNFRSNYLYTSVRFKQKTVEVECDGIFSKGAVYP